MPLSKKKIFLTKSTSDPAKPRLASNVGAPGKPPSEIDHAAAQAKKRREELAESKASIPNNGRRFREFHFKPLGDDHGLNVTFKAKQLLGYPVIGKNKPNADELADTLQAHGIHYSVAKNILSNYALLADDARSKLFSKQTEELITLKGKYNRLEGQFIKARTMIKALRVELDKNEKTETELSKTVEKLTTNQALQKSALETKNARFAIMEHKLKDAMKEMACYDDALCMYGLLPYDVGLDFCIKRSAEHGACKATSSKNNTNRSSSKAQAKSPTRSQPRTRPCTPPRPPSGRGRRNRRASTKSSATTTTATSRSRHYTPPSVSKSLWHGELVSRGRECVLSTAEVERIISDHLSASRDGKYVLPITYVWKKTHKMLNKLFHIIYGNTAKLISKLTVDGMPKLAADCQDPETFLSWYLDYRGWTAIQGVTMYIIGPLPPRPGLDPADLGPRASWDGKVAEGLRYLCAALQDSDLKANVACNATRALDGVANGPTGYAFLKQSMLQGTAEGPAIQQVLDGLRYKIDNSIVSFQSRFTKFANALHPRPAEDILCQKYIMAITGETGATFDAEVTTTIAVDDQTDFNQFAGKLTKLISQKSHRLSSMKTTPVGQHAEAHQSSIRSDNRVKELTKKIAKLEAQIGESSTSRPPQDKRENSRKNGGRNPDSRQRCYKCDKPGCDPKTCTAKPVCDFTFGNGEKCGKAHMRKYCYYEDPSRCRDPKLRRLFERKVQAKSTQSDADAHMASQNGETFGFSVEIVELPMPDAKSFLELPEDIINCCILPQLDDTGAVSVSETCREARAQASGDILERTSAAYDEAWREGYNSPQMARKFKKLQEEMIKPWRNAMEKEYVTRSHKNPFITRFLMDGEIQSIDVRDGFMQSPIVNGYTAEIINAMSTPPGHTHELEDFVFIDTGASDHIISDSRLLINPEEHKPVNIEVRTGTGKTNAKSRGPAKFVVRDSYGQRHEIIRTVIFCPDFKVNLFSPQKDFRDHKTEVTFGDKCSLKLADGTVIPFKATDGMFKMYYKLQKCHALEADTMTLPMRDSPEWVWHRRLGHQSFEKLRLLPASSVGVTINISTDQARKHSSECTICPLARMKAKPHSKNEVPTACTSKYGDRIHMDLAGPLCESYQKKFKYVTIFVDEHTGHIGLYCLKTKDEHQDAHLQYVADMAGVGGMEIREFHSDNGGEFMSNEYIKMIESDGARKTTTSPYTPNLNNIAEGCFWRLFSIVRALLHDSGMPKIHWPAAVQQASYILNRTPTSRKREKVTTPYERLIGRKPNLTHLKIWGCLAHGFVPKPTRTGKLDQVAVNGINYGNSRYQRGWNIYIPGQNKIIQCYTVTFDEKVVYKDIVNFGPPKQVTVTSDSSDDDEGTPTDERRVRPPRLPSFRTCSTPNCTQRLGHLGPHDGEQRGGDGRPSSSLRQRNANFSYQEDTEFAEILDMHHIIFDDSYSDGLDIVALATKRKDAKEVKTDGGKVITIKIPKNFSEVLADPDNKEGWFLAMDAEYDAHMQNGTWILVPLSEVAPGKKIVGSTWAYDVKRNDDGTLSRLKARFCAQGFSQIEGVDYINTYSNTVHHDTLRLMFAIAAAYGLRLTGADVKTAYLYGLIDENVIIYMKQPRGYEKYTSDGKSMVCKLVKSIYGLRQSGARWEATLVQHLLDLGFARSDHDPCLFKIHEGKDLLLLCVYVDDLCFASSSDEYRAKIFNTLTKTFQLTDTGDLTWILNTNISQDLSAGTVNVSQKAYIDEATRKYFPGGLPEKTGRLIPCDETIADLEPLAEGELVDPAYRSGVGQLVWLTSISRPDIAYTHSMLARHNSGGGERHMKHLLKVFEYLGRTSHYKITYSKQNFTKICGFIQGHSSFKTDAIEMTTLFSMVDSSHGGERPMAGVAHFIAGGPIGWRSGRHPITPLNVAQGEYMIATKAVTEIIPHRAVLEFMGSKQESPTIVFTDSTAAVMIADSNTSSKRMKHIATRLAFLREQITAKTAEMYHIRTNGQIADIFTKPTIPAVFHNLREQLLGH